MNIFKYEMLKIVMTELDYLKEVNYVIGKARKQN